MAIFSHCLPAQMASLFPFLLYDYHRSSVLKLGALACLRWGVNIKIFLCAKYHFPLLHMSSLLETRTCQMYEQKARKISPRFYYLTLLPLWIIAISKPDLFFSSSFATFLRELVIFCSSMLWFPSLFLMCINFMFCFWLPWGLCKTSYRHSSLFYTNNNLTLIVYKTAILISFSMFLLSPLHFILCVHQEINVVTIFNTFVP